MSYRARLVVGWGEQMAPTSPWRGKSSRRFSSGRLSLDGSGERKWRAVTENDLRDAWNRHHDSHRGKREDFFGPVYLAKEFSGSVEDFLAQCAFGSNDYGLDAYHVDESRRNLYLFQFKWSEDHNLFKGSLKRLVESGMERVFGNPQASRNENDFLGRLRAEIYEKQSSVDRVVILFVFR